MSSPAKQPNADGVLSFVAALPRSREQSLSSPCPFASLRLVSLSAPLRAWLGIAPIDDAAALFEHVTAEDRSTPLQLSWPTQDPDIESAYARTSYLAYPPDEDDEPLHGGAHLSGAESPHADSFEEEAKRRRGDPLRVRLHEHNPAMDAFLEKQGASSATFVTAWNPRSQQLSRDDNDAKHQQLVSYLQSCGCRWMPHCGRADEGDWAEWGACVLDWTEADAMECTARFAQNAVVQCEKGKEARLIWFYGPHRPAGFKVHVRVIAVDGSKVLVRIEGRAREQNVGEEDMTYACIMHKEDGGDDAKHG